MKKKNVKFASFLFLFSTQTQEFITKTTHVGTGWRKRPWLQRFCNSSKNTFRFDFRVVKLRKRVHETVVRGVFDEF